MKVNKKCKECGLEKKVSITEKTCEVCNGELIRLFEQSENLSVGSVTEDEFVQLNRQMLNAASPSGKDKSCF